MEPSQIALPVEVRPEEIARKQSLGGAIELCVELAGWNLEKTARGELEKHGMPVDKAQFSRWKDGSEGVVWPKLEKLMDICGNDAPIFWMLYKRGFDLHSLRKRQTETEKKLQATEERARKAEERAELLANLLQGKVVA